MSSSAVGVMAVQHAGDRPWHTSCRVMRAPGVPCESCLQPTQGCMGPARGAPPGCVCRRISACHWLRMDAGHTISVAPQSAVTRAPVRAAAHRAHSYSPAMRSSRAGTCAAAPRSGDQQACTSAAAARGPHKVAAVAAAYPLQAGASGGACARQTAAACSAVSAFRDAQ